MNKLKTLASGFTVTLFTAAALIGSTTAAEATSRCSLSQYNYYMGLSSVYEGIAHTAYNRNDFAVTDWALGVSSEYLRQARPYLNACNIQEP